VYSCRNENILIIRCHPNSHKNSHRRGVPRGRPVAFQRRITLYYCRSYSPIGHPQGAPLRWMCSDCAFDFTHERHEIYDVWIFNTMHRERKNIVLFVCSCRNENILIIRCHPNSLKNTHRRGVPRGRPVAFQRRIHCFKCRSYSPIGHPQGAPLRWVCSDCAFDFMHERHEWHDVSYMNKIVLFVYSCRNENILIIRCHPNSIKNTHRRGAPRGRPVAFQRRIHCFKCRSFSPIGHPQGAPLPWMCSDCAFDFMHERHEWHDVSYMNKIVLFVCSCRREYIINIVRATPSSSPPLSYR